MGGKGWWREGVWCALARCCIFFFFLLSMNMSKLSSTDNWFRKLHHEELHGSRVAKEDTNLPANTFDVTQEQRTRLLGMLQDCAPAGC
jgi:hypothetical protein